MTKDLVDALNVENIQMSEPPQRIVNESQKGDLYVSGLRLSRCYSCKQLAVWVGSKLVWPKSEQVVLPNSHMPADVQADFREAAIIVQSSPRGAAALLRLALQKLINGLVGDNIEIDKGIQKLVDEGLPKPVQQACDYVRIVGNEAVHPGTIDLRDDTAMAMRLFALLNLIVVHTVEFKTAMAEIYPTLPTAKLEGVEARMRGAARKLQAEQPLDAPNTTPKIDD